MVDETVELDSALNAVEQVYVGQALLHAYVSLGACGREALGRRLFAAIDTLAGIVNGLNEVETELRRIS